MPHFVIEYSRGIEETVDLDALMTAAHEAGAESGVMKAEDIKVRAIAYEAFRFAGNIQSFVHVTISLLEGRSDRQKEHLAVLLRERLARSCPEIDSISIDVRDMNAAAYKKRLLRRL
jgi:5-carboxymethyl-2-hydroxymuconate isomerase